MIRDAATQAQVDAADPAASTWLSANAGSGKTRVLTDRVARLLLEEVAPQNILCLTYTKAAAAEMQNRLFQRLGKWAMLDDDALRTDLQTLGLEGAIDNTHLSGARKLFASAIETPGGLKIQTIHSFCAAILRRFPLEAQVSPQFREMEDRQAALLRMDVLDDMVTGAHADVVAGLLRHFTGAELDKFVAEIAGKRGAFAVPFDADNLRKTLEIMPGVDMDTLTANTLTKDTAEVIGDAITMLRTGGTNDNKAADKLARVDVIAGTSSELAKLEDVFLYGASAKDPFGPKIGKLATKGLTDAHPELCEALDDLMMAVADARQDRLALTVFERTQALYDFAAAFVILYETRKLTMGLLDFDDLIAKTRDLLVDQRVAEWVLYRLDGGVDHVLVDEAQDTSPTQWEVIEHLTKELVSGEGARTDRKRTIFVVGDKKQSIYSFQGADPDEFDRMETYFADALGAVDDRLEQATLAHSFRSSEAVLRVVDNTFWGDRAAGLGKSVRHLAFKENMPGRVDIWPVIEKSEEVPKGNWFDPVDTISNAHHNVQLADRIAKQIRWMMDHETIPVEIENTGEYNRRGITEGDFLILVQRRSELFSEIIRACKAERLNIAGADRLRVGAELAVKDIAALLSFLALPEDDLSLASALRSPLFGWTEKQLYDLAQPRPEKAFLWEALRESDDHPITRAILDDLRNQADFLRPYDLIERVLTRHDGRRNLLARLGSEAEDGIDALLSQALAFEQNSVPSLTGFLTWLETDALEVKRQMDSQGDRIRVMTVHGAKGLEAPIVILPECQKRPVRVNAELYPAGGQMIWKPRSADMPDSVKSIHSNIVDAQMRERMRLLYVAMTRAKKWLIIAAAGDVGKDDESWYNIASDGIERTGAIDALAGDLHIRRVSALPWDAGEQRAAARPIVQKSDAPVFDALPDLPRGGTLSPSDLGGAKIVPGDPAGDDLENALARGTAMHLLLEHLPATEPNDRATVGQKLLAALSDFHDTDATHALVNEAMAIIENPALSAIFAPGVLAEAGITASVPALNNQRIHGAIDRLIISDDSILAVDFKTNRLVPQTTDDVPEGVLRQQGAYAAALAEIYPNHRIETAILWTQTASLMRLPPQIVAAALARVTTS